MGKVQLFSDFYFSHIKKIVHHTFFLDSNPTSTILNLTDHMLSVYIISESVIKKWVIMWILLSYFTSGLTAPQVSDFNNIFITTFK